MRVKHPPVTWLSDKLTWDENNDKDFIYKAVDVYSKFKFKNIEASIGDFVLVSNADSADPDTEEGCDVAQITNLYESHDITLSDRHRAQVIWYSKLNDLPPKVKFPGPDNILENEVIQDHRPFGNDVSIETFFKKCKVILTPLSLPTQEFNNNQKLPIFICRYSLIKVSAKKYEIEPVIEEERLRLKLHNQLLLTPISTKTENERKKTPRTPTARKSLHSNLLLTPKTSRSTKNIDETGTPSSKLQEKLSQLAISKSKKSNSVGAESLQWTVDHAESTKIVLKCSQKNEYDSDPDFSEFDALPESDDDFTTSSVKRSSNKNTRLDCTPKKKMKSTKNADLTPSTPKRKNINGSTCTTPKTPTLKLLRPNLSKRLTPIVVNGTTDKLLGEEFKLPGREEQLSEILSFISSKVIDKSSGCLYISGVPGTGKTATVLAALAQLKEAMEDGELAPFTVVEINGMQIVEPRQAYVHIYRQLTGKTVASAQACDLLSDRFTKPAPRRTSTVMLVDELDALCTRRQEVIYNLVEWTSHSCARLIVVAIANTMDLPERALSAKVSSRLGHGRMQFPPYNHEQLQKIIQMKLNCGGFLSSDAVQLAARKVSAVSGDARRAIALCTRALELVKQGTTGEGSMGALLAIEEALQEMASGVSVRAIRCCSEAEQRLLKAAAAEVEATGMEEINAIKVADRADLWSGLGGHGTAGGGAKILWRRLSEMRLVSMGAWPRIMLYVNPSDVHYATQNL